MASVTDPGPGAIFHTVHIDMDVPSNAVAWPAAVPTATVPTATLGLLDPTVAVTETLRLSDSGYVNENNVVYQPLIADAFAISRQITMDPQQNPSQTSWGSITINNPAGVLSNVINTRINDHTAVSIYAGRKTVVYSTGRNVDPPSTSLTPMFSGLGRSWRPGYNTIEVDLLDATYWLATSILNPGTYGGTGGLDGTADLTGRMKPMVRGRAKRITPVLIDATNLIYQVSNAACGIQAIYEGGWGSSITQNNPAQTTDIVNASVSSGKFITQSTNSGTYIKLGSKPVYAITLDVSGSFPSGNAASNVLDVVKQFLLEDALLPPAYIDSAWGNLSNYAFPAGWYWDGSSSVVVQDAINTLLAGLGVRLVPTRTGTLRPFAISPGSSSLLVDADTIVSLSPITMADTLDPPTWRWRLGSSHCFTVTASGSGLHPQISAAEQSFITNADRISVWSSSSTRQRYRNPNDSDVVVTALESSSDAATVASRHGALWGSLRRAWVVELPKHLALRVDLGATIAVTWPVPGLSDGATAIVFGEEIQSQKTTSNLLVLAGNF